MSVIRFLALPLLSASMALQAAEVEIIPVQDGAAGASQGYDIVLVVQQMQAEIRQLRGQIDAQRYELAQLKQQQLEMYQDLDARLGGKPISAAPTRAPSVALSGSEEQDYAAAFALVKAQDFAPAQSAFEQYIKAYPKSARAPNAHYWLGEVTLAQGKLEAAAKNFERVIDGFPKSNKVPDAMYKLGRVYQRMGAPDRALSVWKQLVQRYPTAPASTLAKSAMR
ncbi:MAG: tol-pal system protein YbgF [Pseudomonadales bacterium]